MSVIRAMGAGAPASAREERLYPPSRLAGCHSGSVILTPTRSATLSAPSRKPTWSRCSTSPNTSPFASLSGSNHPRPSCVTMMISPSRRNLIARRVLSLMSMAKLALSRTAAQLTRSRSASMSLLFILFPIARRSALVAFFARRFAGTLRPAAKSKGGKGAADKCRIMLCSTAAKPPLRLAVRKRHARGRGRFNEPARERIRERSQDRCRGRFRQRVERRTRHRLRRGRAGRRWTVRRKDRATLRRFNGSWPIPAQWLLKGRGRTRSARRGAAAATTS